MSNGAGNDEDVHVENTQFKPPARVLDLLSKEMEDILVEQAARSEPPLRPLWDEAVRRRREAMAMVDGEAETAADLVEHPPRLTSDGDDANSEDFGKEGDQEMERDRSRLPPLAAASDDDDEEERHRSGGSTSYIRVTSRLSFEQNSSP